MKDRTLACIICVAAAILARVLDVGSGPAILLFGFGLATQALWARRQ